MPFLQSQTANYFGFQPVSAPTGSIQVNPYLVSSSEGTAIYAGDVCVQTSLNTVRALSSAGGVSNFTSSMAYVGVAAMTLGANAGSTAATINSNTSQMILLYDDPQQTFMVCDTTSGVIGSQVGQFKNYSLLTTGCVGSTGNNTTLGRSVQALSGVTSTVAGVFHVLGMHPIEQGIYSTVGAATAGSAVNVRKWIGRFVSGVNVVPSTGLLTIANTTS